MKKLHLFLILTLLVSIILVACGSSTTPKTTPAEEPVVSSPVDEPVDTPAGEPEEVSVGEELVLTLDELNEYNGENGMPAYIAVDGVIYDVTDVMEWNGGKHNGFEAGNDLTEEIKNVSPHGVSKLKGVPIVGKLAE